MAMQIPSFRAAVLLALTLLFITGELAAAREVALPLRFDNALIEKVLVDQLFTGPGQSLVAMKDGSGCNYLLLSDPQLRGADGLLRIRSAARGRVATAIGAQCLVLLDWTGFVETDQRAELDGRNPRVRFRTVDSRLFDDDGEPSAIAGADILAHYLTHYAIRKREDKYGIADALARATYAIYNGGPSHRRRYRLKKTRKSLRAIDKSFYEKYLSIKSGDSKAVMSCYLG